MEHEHEHSPLSGMSTKHKLIGAGAIVAVGLGLWAAHNRSAQGSGVTGPAFSYDGTLYPPEEWRPPSSGSTTPPVITPGDTKAPPVITPAPGGSGNVGGSGGGYVPPVVISYIPATPAVLPYVPPVYDPNHIPGMIDVPGPDLGFGGAKAPVTLPTATPALASEMARTEGVIANREKAGIDTTAQLQHLDRLEAQAAKNILISNGAPATVVKPITYKAADNSVTQVIPETTVRGEKTVVSTTSTVASAGLGVGGGIMAKETGAVKASMVNSQAQIKAGNQSFIQDEAKRAAEVITNRHAAGLDVTDQVAYQKKLVNAGAPVAPAQKPQKFYARSPINGNVVEVMPGSFAQRTWAAASGPQ